MKGFQCNPVLWGNQSATASWVNQYCRWILFYEDRLPLANIPDAAGKSLADASMWEKCPKILLSVRHSIRSEWIWSMCRCWVSCGSTIASWTTELPLSFPCWIWSSICGNASELPYFRGSSDSLGRSLVTEEGFQEHYYEWNEFYDAIFHYAYEVYHRMKKKLKIQEMK